MPTRTEAPHRPTIVTLIVSPMMIDSFSFLPNTNISGPSLSLYRFVSFDPKSIDMLNMCQLQFGARRGEGDESRKIPLFFE